MKLVQLNFGTTDTSYWTAERMAAAEPIPMPLLDTPPSGDGGTGGISVSVPGAPPGGQLELGAPAPVPTPTVYPWCTVGKLFVTLNGQDGSGSAAVVRNNGLLTAAHCLYDPATGATAQNVRFMPAYANGPTPPFGTWLSATGWVADLWMQNTDYGYDIGCAIITAKSGQSIGNVTGYLGYQLNQGTSIPSWNDVGYPANFGGGNTMYEETGNFIAKAGGTVSKGGAFTNGASGDPWFPDGAPKATNGVHSHGVNGQPNVVYSSYFTDWVAGLIAKIA